MCETVKNGESFLTVLDGDSLEDTLHGISNDDAGFNSRQAKEVPSGSIDAMAF